MLDISPTTTTVAMEDSRLSHTVEVLESILAILTSKMAIITAMGSQISRMSTVTTTDIRTSSRTAREVKVAASLGNQWPTMCSNLLRAVGTTYEHSKLNCYTSLPFLKFNSAFTSIYLK